MLNSYTYTLLQYKNDTSTTTMENSLLQPMYILVCNTTTTTTIVFWTNLAYEHKAIFYPPTAASHLDSTQCLPEIS